MLIHFPNSLTEEEEALKDAFAKLKKKKKMVQALKTSAHSQEKETVHAKSAVKKVASSSSIDSADKATEQAKRLVQSGAIKLTNIKEKSGFKRSKTQERKKDSEKPAPGMGFQPFMSFAGDEEEEKQPPNKRMKGLSETFVSAGYGNRNYDRPERSGNYDRPERSGNYDRPERSGNYDRPERPGNYDRPERSGNYDRPEREYREPREPPRKGNTVYVHGVGITEDMLQKSFSNFGKVINISMETERNKAFITFEKTEAADQAINEVNGSMVNNTQLRVQMARHQPSFDALSDASSTASWASIAANNSQKGAEKHRDRRGMVQYDHDDMF